VQAFHHLGHEWDPVTRTLTCRYALDDLVFAERVTFDADAPVDDRRAQRAFRLVHLLAGVSYYKAACPPRVVVPDGLTAAERRLLEAFYLDGLGEMAFRNGLDLRSVRIDAPVTAAPDRLPPDDRAGFPLVPFGGGIDSIVSVEAVRATHPEAALFVLNDYAAIEASIGTTQLPVVRATRRIDPLLLELNERGARNGHVPVTGILSAIAIAAAVLHGADEVVMSNEWSSSQGNLEWHGRVVNHQWSKSFAFEQLLRDVLVESIGSVDYFSLLRPLTSLRIAQRFAQHPQYLATFRSCNRAFHIDERLRRAEWCGECDKCCFVDLVLAPFVDAANLERVFGGREPLRRRDLRSQFDALLGLSGDTKPWECVGDAAECRAAALLAAARDDRADSVRDAQLHALASDAERAHPGLATDASAMLQPIGPHNVPAHHAAALGLG
jgi:hypothetical protein